MRVYAWIRDTGVMWATRAGRIESTRVPLDGSTAEQRSTSPDIPPHVRRLPPYPPQTPPHTIRILRTHASSPIVPERAARLPQRGVEHRQL